MNLNLIPTIFFQGNELVRNATQVLEGFAQSVDAQRKELLEKITKPAN